jgi:hypothetical protein
MPGWLFDSVALIDWYCGRSGIAPYVENVLLGKIQGAFSTVTELELWQGLRSGEEEDHLALLALLERIPLDSAIAQQAGRLRQQVGLTRLSSASELAAPICRHYNQSGRDSKWTPPN